MDYPHSGRVNVSGFNTVVSLMHDQAGPLKPLLNQLGVNTWANGAEEEEVFHTTSYRHLCLHIGYSVVFVLRA